MNEKNRRVAIYARVSTRDQTPENQLRDLRQFSNGRQWQIVNEFVDSAISGVRIHRPALDQCMGYLKKRQADVLLVWRFDRFARSLSHLVNTLETLHSLHVDFISYQESVDTSTPQGRMVFGIMASLAEFERALIKERVLSGIRRAKEKGVEFGRPTISQEKIREVIALTGKPQREIARLCGIGKGTVHRILRMPQNPPQNVASLIDETHVA